MGINLDNKVSKQDIEKVRNSMEHKEFAEGFEPNSGGESLEEFDDFDSIDDLLGGFDDDKFDLSSDSSNSDDIWGGSWDSSDGSSNAFGDTNWASDNSTGNGVLNTQGQTKSKADEHVDAMVEASMNVIKKSGSILKKIAPSIKNRTIDDYGYLGSKLLNYGVATLAVGVIGYLICKISRFGVAMLNLCSNIGVAGGIMTGEGLVILGISAFKLSNGLKDEPNSINDIPEIENSDSNFSDDIDSDDVLDSMLDDESDDDDFWASVENNLEEADNEDNNNDSAFDDMFNTSSSYEEQEEKMSNEELIDSVKENSYMCRQTLLDTFVKILPHNEPSFYEKKEIESYEEKFMQINTICKKVLANVSGYELEDIEQNVESVCESMFSFEIRMPRMKKVNKLTDIERELEVYMRSNSKDVGVIANVEVEGDYYVMRVSKGESKVVTLGDILACNEYYEFFKDESNALPFVTGIEGDGNVIVEDAKASDTMMIAGKPRSGKSWYVLSILASLMLFNTPDDVIALIIDPKDSQLFKTMALLPHVFGLHNVDGSSEILDILADIIEVEAPRRKHLLEDNKCDTIWELREKGIKLPVMYIFIDEYITVRTSLGQASKTLDEQIRIIMSQFPSLGIRLIFVPHRATGVVDKTNRTLLQFKAAVRLDNKDVEDTLDINKWTIPLVNQGDIAVKSPKLSDARFVRGAALTMSDAKNNEFIMTAAKVFYKMGVDVPDMSHLRVACNRNPEYIREELSEKTNREQYNVNNVFDGL